MRYEKELKSLIMREGIFKAMAKEKTVPKTLLEGNKWLAEEIKLLRSFLNNLEIKNKSFERYILLKDTNELRKITFTEIKNSAEELFLQVIRLCVSLDKIYSLGVARQWQ